MRLIEVGELKSVACCKKNLLILSDLILCAGVKINNEQKVVLLTGASRGIGHATVKRFSSDGWRVLTCSRQAFDERCPWPGGRKNHIQVDLADPKQTMAATEEIKSKLNGRLHALINNAGISPKLPDGGRMNTLETDLRVWGQVFHVNFFCIRGVGQSVKR